jgi:protein-disulfide isomerase
MSETKKFELSPSISILIAGVIIAGAVVFTNTRTPAAPVQAAGEQQAPTTQTKVPAPNAQDHIIGSPTAPLVLVEYSDIQCPFCSMVMPTLKRLAEESNGQIAWVYRHFPLDSIHPQAIPAALASECVAEQLGNEGFWKFIDTMFADQSKLGAAYYEDVAKSLGADVTTFKSCVTSQKYLSKIKAQATEAAQNGGQGTPYTILFDKKGQVGVSGALPYETFSAVIKAFLARQ